MANTLRFKRGIASGLPTGAAGEPLFTTDTFDLYIGNGTGNTRFQKYIASGATTQILRGDGSLYTFPLAISSPTNGQVLKYNGTSWVNDSDSGITGSLTTNYLPKATGATTLGNSLISELTAAGNTVTINGTTTNVQFEIKNTTSGSTLMLQSFNQEGYVNMTGTGALIFRQTSSFTERARFHSTGNFGINTGATDYGQRLQVVGTGYFSDSVGIGSTALTGMGLRLSKTITGASISHGYYQNGTVQSDVTTAAYGYRNLLNTQAASFTLADYYHFAAQESSLGAGSAITNVKGFFVGATTVGSSTSVGFQSQIAAGAGRWNAYFDGTANNYMAGSLGIGSTSLTGINLNIGKTITGATTAYGIIQQGIIQTDVTSVGYGMRNIFTTAASVALSDYFHLRFSEGTLGAGTTLANQYGLYINDMSLGTNRYGILSQISAGTGKWNAYFAGTAANYFAGVTQIGSGALTSEQLQVNGTAKITGNTLFDAAIQQRYSGAIKSATYLDASRYTIQTVAFYDIAFEPATVERMRLTTAGNLGIGLTAPTERLHVSGNAIVTGNLTVDTNTLFVDATANEVGIGTTTPTAFLDVRASTTAAASLRIRTGTAPTTPNDGDIWFDGTDLKIRVGGVTKTFTLV